MATADLHDVNSRLAQVIAQLNPGEELVLVENGQPVAPLVRARHEPWPCVAGSAKHLKHWMSPDFDSPLDDFVEYMGR